MGIKQQRIEELKITKWDKANNSIYNLCENENFYHKNEDNIIAKTWIIGRTYAAALERQKKYKTNTDLFYINHVTSVLKNSNLDSYLSELRLHETIEIENIFQIVNLHSYLMRLLSKITKKEVRSFSSKYLHFHLPSLFFLYDSRSNERINKIVKKIPDDLSEIYKEKNFDNDYRRFYCKAFELRRRILKKHRILLSPRHLDNILLYSKIINF